MIKAEKTNLDDIQIKIKEISSIKDDDVGRLAPLFQNKEEYEKFYNRHKMSFARRKKLEDYKGKVFLGIDSGSTTVKLVLINTEGEVLYSYYANNHGDPLSKLISVLKDIYRRIPKDVEIAYSTVTGYGESFIKAALRIDLGEIETVSHYRAADYFLPGVDFIIDIGGQDMKCIRIKNGAIIIFAQ